MPKVLITNGSVLGTWYEGKEGTLYDVNYSSEHNHMVKEDEVPAVFQRGVAKADGVLLYTEAEYNELHSAYNELRRQRDKVIDDLAQHAQTIVDLQNEKLMLLQQIERTVDERKVELPRKVGLALKSFQDDGHDIDQILRLMLSAILNSQRLKEVRSYAKSNGWEFVSALVNGYTIELEPREKVKQFIEKWYTTPGGDTSEDELYELTDGIIDLLQKSS